MALFSEFSPVSKEEWLKKVEKDLKGRPLSDLNWSLDDLTLSALTHVSDLTEQYAPLTNNRRSNAWKSCVQIPVKDPKIANANAINYLELGANALSFTFEKSPSQNDLTTLFKNIELGWISTNYIVQEASAGQFLDDFIAVAKAKGEDLTTLKCSFQLADEFQSVEQFNAYLNAIPKARLVTVNAVPFCHQKEGVIHELTQIVQNIHSTIANAVKEGYDFIKVCATLQISLTLTDDYFVNIAKLRAIRLLWWHYATAYEVSTTSSIPLLSLQVVLTDLTHTADEHYNKIKATSQAMAAVIGGANRLIIQASDKEQSPFAKRIALNVQHLLQLESYFDRVLDPAAGSYFIENLSTNLAEKAWINFQTQTPNS